MFHFDMLAFPFLAVVGVDLLQVALLLLASSDSGEKYLSNCFVLEWKKTSNNSIQTHEISLEMPGCPWFSTRTWEGRSNWTVEKCRPIKPVLGPGWMSGGHHDDYYWYNFTHLNRWAVITLTLKGERPTVSMWKERASQIQRREERWSHQ